MPINPRMIPFDKMMPNSQENADYTGNHELWLLHMQKYDALKEENDKLKSKMKGPNMGDLNFYNKFDIEAKQRLYFEHLMNQKMKKDLYEESQNEQAYQKMKYQMYLRQQMMYERENLNELTKRSNANDQAYLQKSSAYESFPQDRKSFNEGYNQEFSTEEQTYYNGMYDSSAENQGSYNNYYESQNNKDLQYGNVYNSDQCYQDFSGNQNSDIQPQNHEYYQGYENYQGNYQMQNGYYQHGNYDQQELQQNNYLYENNAESVGNEKYENELDMYYLIPAKKNQKKINERDGETYNWQGGFENGTDKMNQKSNANDKTNDFSPEEAFSGDKENTPKERLGNSNVYFNFQGSKNVKARINAEPFVPSYTKTRIDTESEQFEA